MMFCFVIYVDIYIFRGYWNELRADIEWTRPCRVIQTWQIFEYSYSQSIDNDVKTLWHRKHTHVIENTHVIR